MSNKYIVRQSVKDSDGVILGYEILYCGENQAFTTEDSDVSRNYAAADTIYSFLTQNSNKALKGTLNFMTFTTMLLMKKTPHLFDRSELVIQIDDSVIIHPLSMHFVKMYAKEGYKIAVNEFQFVPRYLALLDSIDYIKVNASMPATALRDTMEIAHSMGKKCIVTHIESKEQHDLAVSLKADGLQGNYEAATLKTKSHSSSYLHSNFFRLMVAVTKDEPDVNEIEQLIAMDASLSYGLLKMANSAYFALCHRATTIHQAIMTLGLGQLRQWIYLLSSSNPDQKMDAGTEEFLRISFMRASFSSELMKHAKDMPISRSEAYLLGMFSTLNHLINAPMEEILAEVPVSDDIKEALLTQSGRCGVLYQLVLAYEQADWDIINSCAEELGIPSKDLTNIYFDCMEGENVLWDQLTKISPNQK